MHLAPEPPDHGDTWLGLTEAPLPVGTAHDWCVVPRSGAVVLFSGVVRDHATDADGVVRAGVDHLWYEAYESQVVPAFVALVDELRRRWPDTCRVAVLHRIGRLELGETSVLVVVSAPHRAEAFEAGQWAIDALKASAPIWKREQWETDDGVPATGWGTNARAIVEPASVPSAPGRAPE